MSNVSNSHNVVSFVSGKSEALTGQRLVVAKYKSTLKTSAKYPNVCASIPKLGDSITGWGDLPDSLFPHALEWLEQCQNDTFKSVYESKLGVMGSVHESEIGIDAIVGFLSAVQVSGRLTKEAIEAWYKTDMEGIIKVTAAVKKGYIGADSEDEELKVSEAQEKDLMQVCNSYRDLFSGLAGGTTRYSVQIQGSLTKMLGLCADSTMADKLLGRVEGMKKVESFAELL